MSLEADIIVRGGILCPSISTCPRATCWVCSGVSAILPSIDPTRRRLLRPGVCASMRPTSGDSHGVISHVTRDGVAFALSRPGVGVTSNLRLSARPGVADASQRLGVASHLLTSGARPDVGVPSNLLVSAMRLGVGVLFSGEIFRISQP
eukprot:3129397-Prymnesium_polylepis.3